MNEIRVIFSPHTADPDFVAEVAVAMVVAQWSVAQAMWGAQIRVWQATLTAQLTFMDSVSQAACQLR